MPARAGKDTAKGPCNLIAGGVVVAAEIATLGFERPRGKEGHKQKQADLFFQIHDFKSIGSNKSRSHL